jgi:hypothetical protein
MAGNERASPASKTSPKADGEQGQCQCHAAPRRGGPRPASILTTPQGAPGVTGAQTRAGRRNGGEAGDDGGNGGTAVRRATTAGDDGGNGGTAVKRATTAGDGLREPRNGGEAGAQRPRPRRRPTLPGGRIHAGRETPRSAERRPAQTCLGVAARAERRATTAGTADRRNGDAGDGAGTAERRRGERAATATPAPTHTSRGQDTRRARNTTVGRAPARADMSRRGGPRRTAGETAGRAERRRGGRRTAGTAGERERAMQTAGRRTCARPAAVPLSRHQPGAVRTRSPNPLS